MTVKTKRKPLPPIVRVDVDGPEEIYVLVVDDCGDYVPDSLHTNLADAKTRARWLAKMMGCKWVVNLEGDPVQ